MRVEVLGGVERRRRWSRDDKMRIIEETLAPGAVVTEIARRHGIATSLVFTWRRARLATVASAGSRPVSERRELRGLGLRQLGFFEQRIERVKLGLARLRLVGAGLAQLPEILFHGSNSF